MAKHKFSIGLLRGAVVSGLVSVLAAASLGGVGTANASCLSIGGFFSIGSGCTSSPLSFALALGPNRVASAEGLFTGAIAIGTNNVANAEGFLTSAIAIGLNNTSTGPPNTIADSRGAISLAYAGGNNAVALTFGNLAIAAGQGDSYLTQAGGTPTDIGNVALSLGNHNPPETGDVAAVVAGDTGGPATRSPSYFNLAANLGDDNNVQSQGLGSSVLNILGNGNSLSAIGVLNNGTTIFGDDNDVQATNVPDPTANILQQIGGNVAFTALGNGNTALAGSQIAPPPGGPLAIVGTLGVDDRTISRPGTGISIATPFNSTGSNTNVLAAGGTQGSLFRPNPTGSTTSVLAGGNKFAPTTFATGTADRAGSQLSGSLTKAGKQFSSSLNQISSSLNEIGSSLREKVGDNVQNALGGFGEEKKQNSEPGSDGPETGGDS